MYLTVTLLTAAMAPQGPGTGPSTAPVVINEFSYDDVGTDEYEFVELYNRSGAPVDISGWQLLSEDPNGPNTPFAIPAATILAAGDYYVLGSALVPNVDQVVGVSNIWENSQESLTLVDATGAVIDTLGYEIQAGAWNPAVLEGEGIWGNYYSVSSNLDTSWSRFADGYDSNNNGRDFKMLPWSPGATNDSGLPPFYVEPFDGLTVGDDLANWGSSWFPPRVIDPTVVDANNPNAIPASPQGGNAMILWDPSGGGDMATYNAPIGPGQIFDAWVYFDATPEPVAGQNETWSIGFGSTGTFFNTPDPSGTLGFTSNGNTGISWTYQTSDAGATLYLVDHNDGGWGTGANTDTNVVTAIPITPGVNDGWRRLRLEVIGQRLAIGTFDGGTPVVSNPFAECMAAGGFPWGNGVNIPTECMDPASATAYDTLYIGYREFVTNNAGARPPTIDDMLLLPSSANIAYLGAAAPTTVGTPVIAANSPPVIGNSALEIQSFNLTPAPFSFFAVSFFSTTTNLQPLGGQPGATALNMGQIALVPASGGMASFAMPLPNAAVLVGLPLYFQAGDIDPALAFPIPAGTSAVLEITIGG